MARQRFQQQVVLITGATSGIGLELARAFRQEGATVIGTGRDQLRLKELASEVDLALTLDVADESSVEVASAAILDRYGAVDVLINNAGIGMFAPWDETAISDIRRVMDVNFYGVIRICGALLPAMVERGSGIVVNIASVAGKRAYPKHTAYCASKHALIGWSDGLRKDLQGSGVDVLVVCPPAVDTPFFENAGFDDYKAKHPGLTLMTAAEVAHHTVEATHNRDRERILSTRARVLWLLDTLSPSLVDGLQKMK